MKKITKLFYILCFAVIMQSCKDNTAGIKFQITENGSYERLDSTIFISTPLSMAAYQNSVFISDFSAPMIIHYDLHSREINRFLSIGRGPGETMPPVSLYSNPIGDKKLYRFSKQFFDLGYYPIDSLPGYSQVFRLSSRYWNVIPYSTDRYISSGFFEDSRYQLLNEKGEVLQSFGSYPDFLDDEISIPYGAKAIFHATDFAINNSRQKIVSKSYYVLDIIDYSSEITDGSITRILLAPYDYEYTGGGAIFTKERDGTVKGASEITCNSQFIYILFNPGIVGEENIGVNREIWVLDWNGKPVKKIRLDINLELIAAPSGSDESFIYGLAAVNDEGDYELVKISI